ncbi:hypothetical protein KM043_010289 [Ampulex compressa]|nr:hypothetical protein KM043_010289 [Ampulex compressa]
MDLSDLRKRRFTSFLKIAEPRFESRRDAPSEPSISIAAPRTNIEEMVAPRKYRRSPRKHCRVARATPLFIDRLRTDLQRPDYFVQRVRSCRNWCPEFLSKYFRENNCECEEEDCGRLSSSGTKTLAPERPKIYSVGLQGGSNASKMSSSEEFPGLSAIVKSLRRCYNVIHRGCLSLMDQKKSSVYDHFSHEEVEPEEWPKPSLIASSSSISPYPVGQALEKEYPGIKPDFSVIYCKHGRSMIKENSEPLLESIAPGNSFDLLSNVEYPVARKCQHARRKRHRNRNEKAASMHDDIFHGECEIMAEAKKHFGVAHESRDRGKSPRLTRDVEVQTTGRKKSHTKRSRKKDKSGEKLMEELECKYEGFSRDKNGVCKEVDAIFARNISNITNEAFNSRERTRFEVFGQKRITNYTSKFVETKEKLEKICGMLRDIDVNADATLSDNRKEDTIKSSLKRRGRGSRKINNNFKDDINNSSRRTGNSDSIVYAKRSRGFHEGYNETVTSSSASILNSSYIKQTPKMEIQMRLGTRHTPSSALDYDQQLLEAKVSEMAILESVKRRIDEDFDASRFKEVSDNEEHRSISIIATKDSRETEFNRGIYFESSSHSDSFMAVEESKSLPLMSPWRMIRSSKKNTIHGSASTTITIQRSRRDRSDARYFSCTKLSSLDSIPSESSYHTPLRIRESEDFNDIEYAMDSSLKYLSPIERMDFAALDSLTIADNYGYGTSRDSTFVSRNDSSDSAKTLEASEDLHVSRICSRNSDKGETVVVTSESSKHIVESVDSGVSTDLSPVELCISGNSFKIEDLKTEVEGGCLEKSDAVCSLNFNSDSSCSDDALERKVDNVVKKFTENLIICERRAKMKLRKLEKAKRERSTMKRRKYPREVRFVIII